MATWHVWLLDESLVRVGELPLVTSVSVTRDATGDVLASASVEYEGDPIPDGTWCRIEARGEYLRQLGVFRMAGDGSRLSNGRMVRRLLGQSVLAPAAERSIPDGYSVAAGTDVGSFVRSMLDACPCRVIVHGNAATDRALVFDGESRLAAAWDVLDAVGWRIRLTGDGDAHVEPLPTEEHVVGPHDWHGLTGEVSLAGGILSWQRSLDDEFDLLDPVRFDGDRLVGSVRGRVTTQSVTSGASFGVVETIGAGRSDAWR